MLSGGFVAMQAYLEVVGDNSFDISDIDAHADIFPTGWKKSLLYIYP